jgi:spore coat polysaccharide biosynthesis protein SpsF
VTALILQARLDSSRLPGKSLLPLEGKPLVYRVMEALNTVPCDLRILASPEDCEESFRPLALAAGFEFFSGPKEDVLARFCLALRRFFPDVPGLRLIRATADNPFVFADAASRSALNRASTSRASTPAPKGRPP